MSLTLCLRFSYVFLPLPHHTFCSIKFTIPLPTSSLPYILFFFSSWIYSLASCLSIHPPFHIVFQRGLKYLPFPFTHFLIRFPDTWTSLCSTNTLCSQYFLPPTLSFSNFSFILKDTFIQVIFSLLLNRRARLITGDIPHSDPQKHTAHCREGTQSILL